MSPGRFTRQIDGVEVPQAHTFYREGWFQFPESNHRVGLFLSLLTGQETLGSEILEAGVGNRACFCNRSFKFRFHLTEKEKAFNKQENKKDLHSSGRILALERGILPQIESHLKERMLDCVEEMWSQIQIQELHYLGQNVSFECAHTYLDGILPGMS